ncbi:uncharacterized protein LOC123542072 [Mercenaria mercenaria]|uniref:uncharacterized protein LOC123542072 n=1 Tax=Mercenaria mercenaria TaxID=6596 RepID=UPI00234EB570|nr:uncharacterized protein LOC123542072 [Mercenaria mercenaria]
MDELSEAPSTVCTESSQQISLEVEDAATIDKKCENNDSFDETYQERQKHERSCIRYFICVLLCTSVVFGILGTIIYFAVLKTNEQPLLTPGSDSNSVFPEQRPTTGQKQNASSLETGNDVKNDCPGNWTYYNKKCYHFIRSPVHISDAKEHCATVRGAPLNTNNETKTIPEFMVKEIQKFIGCCLYDLRRNETGILENIEEEIANSLSIPYDPEWNIMDDIGQLADDSPKSVTRLPSFNQHAFTSHLPSSAGARNFDDHLSNLLNTFIIPSLIEASNTNVTPYTSTPTSPYGFLLGGGHQHNHFTTPPGNSYQTTNIFDRLFEKKALQSTQPNVEITRPDTETTQPNIVDRPPATSAHAPETLPGISQPVAEKAHVSTKNHGPAPQKQYGQDGNGPMSTKMSSLEIFCRRYEPHLPEWRETGCLGSYVQICERNP